jgi:hypothetical protein
MTVFEAWAAVMGDVRAIEKNQQNTQQGFSFRGIDATMQAVGPALRSHQVMVIPTGQELKTESYQTRSGTQMKNVTVTVQYRVYGPEGDHFEGVAYGEAADVGDKAVTKAQSVALRTFLLQALMVPTGDPDPDAVSHERAVQDANPALDEANEVRGDMLKDLTDAGWTGAKLIKRFKDDYAADLLAADAKTVKAFWKALAAEARAQDADAVGAVGTPVEQETK